MNQMNPMKQSDFEFKRTIFGGFDRKDVSRYIAMLAAERNELSEKCSELSERAAVLEEENRDLHRELEAAMAALMTSEETCELIGTEFADEADRALTDFKASCDGSLASLRESAEAVICEVSGLDKLFSSVYDAADAAKARINELCLKSFPTAQTDPPVSGADTPDTEKAE